MAAVDYAVANGRIISETRAGSHKFYHADALGSTVGVYDDTQTKTDSFTYWPYGETRTSSGSTATKYRFIGTLGCRTQTDGRIYMRARVEQPKDGRWTTVDPLWPLAESYVYAGNSPATITDPSGLNIALTALLLLESQRPPKPRPGPQCGPTIGPGRPKPKPIIGPAPSCPQPGMPPPLWVRELVQQCLKERDIAQDIFVLTKCDACCRRTFKNSSPPFNYLSYCYDQCRCIFNWTSIRRIGSLGPSEEVPVIPNIR